MSNIAFTTILIVIVMSPGFVFNSSFYSGTFSKKHIKISFTDQISTSILPAIVFNILWYFLVPIFSKYYVSFDILGKLLVGPKTDHCIEECFLNIKIHTIQISIYFFSIWLFAFLMGHFWRSIIRSFKLDLKFKSLRIGNVWHYQITGECLEFPNFPKPIDTNFFKIIKHKIKFFWLKLKGSKKADRLKFIYAEVLVNSAGKEILYIGEIEDFMLDRDDDLKSIFLKDFTRTDLSTKPLKEIEAEGNLIIPFSSILNINIRYYGSRRN